MEAAKKWPHLCAPNDGYDENGLWNGMTPEEVDEACMRAVEENKKVLDNARYWFPGVGLPLS